jgi:hypothetical protein
LQIIHYFWAVIWHKNCEELGYPPMKGNWVVTGFTLLLEGLSFT